MRVLALVVMFGGLCVRTAEGQEARLWMELTGDRIILDALLCSVGDDSVTLSMDGRARRFSLGEIEQIRVVREKSMVNGALAGAGVGIVAGGIVGSLGRSPDDTRVHVASAVLTLGMMGGIVGAVVASSPDQDELLDFSVLTLDQRKAFLHSLLQANGQSP